MGLRGEFLIVVCIFLAASSFFSIGLVIGASFVINGTIHDQDGNLLNGTNISVVTYDSSLAIVATNETTSNLSGWFNLSLPGELSDSYMYKLAMFHPNGSGDTRHVAFVGSTLPFFFYTEMSSLTNVNYYLKEAATINITVRNSSNDLTAFNYQIKDTALGFPTGVCIQTNNQIQTLCYVPREKNYSIFVFPNATGGTQFPPVNFDWNNFSSTVGHNILDGNGANASEFNFTKRTLTKQFNVSVSFARITGFINGTDTIGVHNWTEINMVPFLLENNIIHPDFGLLHWNASAWNNETDSYNISNGFYNISVPYSPAESSRYLFFAAGNNETGKFGGYRNLTITGHFNGFNFSMYGLLGNSSDENNITMKNASVGGGSVFINTTLLKFNIINNTNYTLKNLDAHIETVVDYSDYDVIEFTFTNDINTADGTYSLPLINVTGVKEINIYSQNFAPKRVSTQLISQLNTNSNITMKTFNPVDIDGNIGAGSITISLYKSNETCDIPNPATGCSLVNDGAKNLFNMFSAVMGGGKISFRMGSGGVLVHYVNVDMLASGPPDALFDDNSQITEDTTDNFDKAFRFGSQGPTIYDYILISIPYTEGGGSSTGLNENAAVNISIPILYDDDWNVIWNVSDTVNGSDVKSLYGNYSHYTNKASEWSDLLNQSTCHINQTGINTTDPCFIDKTNNRIWLRIPHFSGTGPSVTGSVSAASTTTSTSSSDSSGGTSEKYWSKTIPRDGVELIDRSVHEKLKEKERVRIKINGDLHHVGVTDISASDKVTINISSTPQQKLIYINEINKFEINDDNFYDVNVVLNEVSESKANISIFYLHEEIPSTPDSVAGGNDDNQTGDNSIDKDFGKGIGKIGAWIVVIMTLGIAGLLIYFYFQENKKKNSTK